MVMGFYYNVRERTALRLIASRHVISRHITSHNIVSRPVKILPHRIASRHVTLRYIGSNRGSPRLTVSESPFSGAVSAELHLFPRHDDEGGLPVPERA